MNNRHAPSFVSMKKRVILVAMIPLLVVSCSLLELINNKAVPINFATRIPFGVTSSALIPTSANLPTPENIPGQFLDYLAQTGDTLPSVAAHFNTTEAAMRAANPGIPLDATTLRPGSALKIPFIDLPSWGSSYKIIPDEYYVNGPLAIKFKTSEFIAQYPGWLKDYHFYAGGLTRPGAEMVDLVALNFSIHPQLLLALLEYQTHALSDPQPPTSIYTLGYVDVEHEGLYLQLVWAANMLNDGYYSWRSGETISFEKPDGKLEIPYPWQNAATVALQTYFIDSPLSDYASATGPEGIAATFMNLFGNPWEINEPLIPENLKQPDLLLPFQAGERWSLSGGPHSAWGTLEPFAAIDFTPVSHLSGCQPSDNWVVAMADGVIARSEIGILVLDLDGDGDERTGWNIFYLHAASNDRAVVGIRVNAGDKLGHPSCEGRGAWANGTHIHIARKYNGEWIPADGTLAFNLEGWVAHDGITQYMGTLTRGSETITACVGCSNSTSQITAGE